MSAWAPGLAVALVDRGSIGEMDRLTRGAVVRVTKTFVEVVDEAGARTRWTLQGWPWGAKATARGPRLRPWSSPQDEEHCRRADALEALERSAFDLRQSLRDGPRGRGLPVGRVELAAKLLAQAVEALS